MRKVYESVKNQIMSQLFSLGDFRIRKNPNIRCSYETVTINDVSKVYYWK